MRFTICAGAFVSAILACALGAQTLPQPSVPLQPLAQQVRRLETALRYLGQPLADSDS